MPDGDNGNGQEDIFSGGRVSALVTQEMETQQDRFSIPTQEQDTAKEKSLEELAKEQATMKNIRRRNKRENLKIEGATDAEAFKYTLKEIAEGRNQAIHQVLQKRGMYNLTATKYQQQRAQIPPFWRGVNSMTQITGYRIPSIRRIEDRIQLIQSANQSQYRPELKEIVQETGNLFLTNCKQKVTNYQQRGRQYSENREELVQKLDDMKYNAQDRADYIIELKAKVQEYNQGIAQTQAKIREIKRKHGKDLTDEAKEALRYHERMLEQYKANRKEALQSVDDSENDLLQYHTDILALQSDTKIAEAIEGKFLEMYAPVKANLSQALHFINSDDSKVGYVEAFEIMQNLADINQGLIPLLGPLMDSVKDSFDAIEETKVSTITPELDATITNAAQLGKQHKQDLVEMYRSPAVK